MNNYNNGYGGYSNGRYFNTPAYTIPAYQQNYAQRPIDQPQQNGLFFNNIRYVTPEDMEKYIVNLGNTDVLINKQDKIIKIKSADMAGNSFDRTFKYEELNIPSTVEQPKQDLDLSGYVKTDDLKDFIKVDALTQFSKQIDDKIEVLKKELSENKNIQ